MHSPAGPSFPALLSTNIRSSFTKLSDLSHALQPSTHLYICVIGMQEWWLNSEVANSLASIDSLRHHRRDKVFVNASTNFAVNHLRSKVQP